MTEVRTYLGNMDPLSTRFTFVKERNGTIAEKIARYQGFSYNPEPLMKFPHNKTYIVPGITLSGHDRGKFLIRTVEDFYGGMTPEMSYVGKAVLHPAIGDTYPSFYDEQIYLMALKAQEIGLVLPGVTIFSAKDAINYYDDNLRHHKPFSYRLKTTNDSDGEGQAALENKEHLAYLLTHHSESSISKDGLVIEQNVTGPKKTISVGTFFLGRDKYSFVADQKNGRGPDGRDIYLGAQNVHVVRGGFDELHDIVSRQFSPVGLHATTVEKTAAFDLLYRSTTPILASRLSYDMLIGIDQNGNPLEGITDITARLGGTCPALMLAALNLQKNQSHQAVVAEVNLNYQPQQKQEYEKNAEIIMDQEPLRITAKIDQII